MLPMKRTGNLMAEKQPPDVGAWAKRALVVTGITTAAVVVSSTAAFAASSHLLGKWGTSTKGEAWFNSGNCCIAQRNAFTVKDWLIDGYEIKVNWTGARTGSFRLQDGTNREETFSIEPNNVTRAAIQWRVCVVDNPTGISSCTGYITDYID